MKISRIVIKNFRAFAELDVLVKDKLCCVIGENNTGKTALFRALQICLDVSMPGYHRTLVREDINSNVDITHPSQVLIGVELIDFEGNVNEEALVSTWKTGQDTARIFYRFRPRRHIREKINAGDLEAGTLTIDDYSWEIKGGGDPGVDLTDIEWDDDEIGETVRFSDLQSYMVTSLPALRDVESELRNRRTSPLSRLIESFEVGEDERQNLIDVLNEANEKISGSKTIEEIGQTLDGGFKSVAGPAFEMSVTLGISEATYQSIIHNMRMLLSDSALQNFEPARNGLGMNNILYAALILEYFKKRIERDVSAGQLLLIEEPEAHLHPQLQASLMTALNELGVQVVMTSHSTQITSQASFSSLVALTRRADNTIGAATLSENPSLDPQEMADLERYLDATKSNLLFARRVMLVEGAAELFLVPALTKFVLGIDLERSGVSIVAIHGVHFNVYTKLFREGCIEKKCAVVADADMKPSDASEDFDVEENAPRLADLQGEFVNVFAGQTTFERELVSVETLTMLIATTDALGATRITQTLTAGLGELVGDEKSAKEKAALLEELRDTVLRTAERFGKARFAQVAARYASLCTGMPKYINDAVAWLLE